MSEEDQGRGYCHHLNLWVNDRCLETLEHLRRKYGSTISGAFRAGLEIIRKHEGLDDDKSHNSI